MKSKSSRKRHHLADKTDTIVAQPTKKRRKTEKPPVTSDSDDSDKREMVPRSRQRSKNPQPSTGIYNQPLDTGKVYLNTRKGFMKSYNRLLGLDQIFKQVLESNESSSDSEVSDYSISSFEDPVSDDEPFQQVPASNFIISTKVRRKDGTEKLMSRAKSTVRQDESQATDGRS